MIWKILWLKIFEGGQIHGKLSYEFVLISYKCQAPVKQIEKLNATGYLLLLVTQSAIAVSNNEAHS